MKYKESKTKMRNQNWKKLAKRIALIFENGESTANRKNVRETAMDLRLVYATKIETVFSRRAVTKLPIFNY